MLNSKNVQSRYNNDMYFRTIVDTLHNLLREAKYTPTEVREAAMLAQIHYEMYNVRPMIFTKDDIINDK